MVKKKKKKRLWIKGTLLPFIFTALTPNTAKSQPLLFLLVSQRHSSLLCFALMSEFKGFLFTGTKTRLLKVLFCCCGFAWSPAFWTIIYNFTVGKTLSLTWVGWISSFLVLHLLYFTAAADSSVFTVRLLKMSLQLQGAQRWISYGRASAGRKTFTCRSRVGRTSGRQTKRQSAPANAALESRWLPHTHTHLRTHHFRHRNGVQGWPHFDAFLPLRNFFIPPSSPRTRLVINHNHSESLSTVFI